MPIIYNHQPDDFVSASAPFRGDDDGSAWWAGAQRCFASVALATVVSFTSLSTAVADRIHHQTEDIIPAPSLHVLDNGDYWQIPVRAVAATLQYVQQSAFDQQECVLAAASTAIVDEDYWFATRPFVTTASSFQLFVFQQSAFDQQECVSVAASTAIVDEDYWSAWHPSLSATTLVASQPYLYDAGENAFASATSFTPDEDYWIAASASVSSSAPIASLPYIHDQAELFPQPTLFPVQDDSASLLTPLLLTTYSSNNAGSQPPPHIYDVGDVVFPPAQPFTPDEDFWPVAPFVGQPSSAMQQPFAFDADELSTFMLGQVDEDYWPLFSFASQLTSAPQPFTMNTINWYLTVAGAEDIISPQPDKIPGPYWIRCDGHAQGLFGKRRR